MRNPETRQLNSERIPLTLLTGFLGSGKTTLLRRYLESTKAGETAVIINEYGATQIDGDLVTFAGDTTAVRTTTGCLCCTISGDVKEALLDLARAIETKTIRPFGHLIIETTGLADPISLIHAVTTDTEICRHYQFKQTVTLIDAIHGEHWFERHAECRQQIALADKILLTKTDLINDPVSRRETDQFILELASFNPMADILSSQTSETMSLLDPTNKTVTLQDMELTESIPHKHRDHHHHHGVNSYTLVLEKPIEQETLMARLFALGETYGRDLLRVKGFVRTKGQNSAGSLLVQGVGGIMQFENCKWPPSSIRSELVFITNALSQEEAYGQLFSPSERVNPSVAAEDVSS
ncbi:MAG: GTP-binding protein [Pseudomonadota bacterium]